MCPVNTASIITFCIRAIPTGVLRSTFSFPLNMELSTQGYEIVPYFQHLFEKDMTLLISFSINGEHFVGRPLVMMLLKTAKIGSISS